MDESFVEKMKIFWPHVDKMNRGAWPQFMMRENCVDPKH